MLFYAVYFQNPSYIQTTCICRLLCGKSWILNGGIEEEWDSYLQKMEDYGLSEYLEIKQKYFDAYIESLSDDN